MKEGLLRLRVMAFLFFGVGGHIRDGGGADMGSAFTADHFSKSRIVGPPPCQDSCRFFIDGGRRTVT